MDKMGTCPLQTNEIKTHEENMDLFWIWTTSPEASSWSILSKLSKQCSSNVQAAAAGSCTLNSLVLEVDEPKRLKAHIGELEDHEAHSTFHTSRLVFLGSSQHKTAEDSVLWFLRLKRLPELSVIKRVPPGKCATPRDSCIRTLGRSVKS